MRELQPVNQYVLLDLDAVEQKEQKVGAIIIPDTLKEKQKIGKVIAISNIENSEISVGDNILYKDFTGTETELDGKKFLLVPYADILAKIVETESI